MQLCGVFVIGGGGGGLDVSKTEGPHLFVTPAFILASEVPVSAPDMSWPRSSPTLETLSLSLSLLGVS